MQVPKPVIEYVERVVEVPQVLYQEPIGGGHLMENWDITSFENESRHGLQQSKLENMGWFASQKIEAAQDFVFQ